MSRTTWKCNIFGHKWNIVYVGKTGVWGVRVAYCGRCHEGYSDVIDMLNALGYQKGYNFGTYHKSYYDEHKAQQAINPRRSEEGR